MMTRIFRMTICLLFLLLALDSFLLAEVPHLPEQFLYGASVYPELQTQEEWNRMLDTFQKARMNVVRVSESSWGNLETAPGQYNFGWLKNFLDDLQKRGMKAILGTSSYLAPQWLAAKHPEILVQLEPGVPVHPMGRKAACIHHPLYREALHRYLLALGAAFKDHPAVIGWQLDNEIEFTVGMTCYNPACEKAWQEWLKQTYHSPEELNRRLRLVSWGMEISTLEEIPQPRPVVEGGPRVPALTLANLHFHRDSILAYFSDQTRVLREAGVKQWITTDWNSLWLALADDPKVKDSLDWAGLNFYAPSREDAGHWVQLAWNEDKQRAAHGLDRFLITETRFGVAGDAATWDAAPVREQFRMWVLQPVAFGASGLLFWSGNRWHGGHWPHWGGLLDWTGHPEPDFPWGIQMGELFEKWGKKLLDAPVQASAAVLTDFDQRAALQVYPHTVSSKQLLGEIFDLLHRQGIGADSLNLATAQTKGLLRKYALVVLAADPALDGQTVPAALKDYVEDGGNLIITPFTAYQDWDGIFRNDGFGANLTSLSGTLVRTVRRMGSQAEGEGWPDQKVEWSGMNLRGESPVGIDGFCEFLEVRPETEVIAHFRSNEPILDGKPAATMKKLGKGTVIKLAFWPSDGSLTPLFRQALTVPQPFFKGLLPHGAQAVPRKDGSLFIVNTARKPASMQFAKPVVDRFSGSHYNGEVELKGFDVLWVAEEK